MILLISKTDFSDFRYISEHISSEKRLDQYIREAQMFDLMELMGRAFFYHVLDDAENSPTSQATLDLLSGVDYTDNYGHLIKFEGLKPVLVYFSYARFLANQNVTASSMGIVQKKNEFSDPVDEKTLQRLITQARSSALAYWSQAECYLREMKRIDSTAYSIWNSFSEKRTSKIGRAHV